jgi:hypothetical protein
MHGRVTGLSKRFIPLVGYRRSQPDDTHNLVERPEMSSSYGKDFERSKLLRANSFLP